MTRMVHPDHGVTDAVGSEIEWNIKHGWKVEEAAPVAKVAQKSLAERYAEKFGKPPHHRMRQETIEAALNEDDIV